MNKGKKLMEEFEHMRGMAELRALSNISLQRPLSDAEFGIWNDVNLEVA